MTSFFCGLMEFLIHDFESHSNIPPLDMCLSCPIIVGPRKCKVHNWLSLLPPYTTSKFCLKICFLSLNKPSTSGRPRLRLRWRLLAPFRELYVRRHHGFQSFELNSWASLSCYFLRYCATISSYKRW